MRAERNVKKKLSLKFENSTEIGLANNTGKILSDNSTSHGYVDNMEQKRTEENISTLSCKR